MGAARVILPTAGRARAAARQVLAPVERTAATGATRWQAYVPDLVALPECVWRDNQGQLRRHRVARRPRHGCRGFCNAAHRTNATDGEVMHKRGAGHCPRVAHTCVVLQLCRTSPHASRYVCVCMERPPLVLQ